MLNPNFKKLYEYYKADGWVSRVRTFQRWYCGTPYEYVEKYVPKEGIIIDLGCGWGVFSSLLALLSPHRKVTGVDIDQVKINRANNLSSRLPNLQFFCGNLKDWQVPECDAVVIYDVLHHLNPTVAEGLLKDVYSKLKEGGKLILKENDTEPYVKLKISDLVEFAALGFNITQSEKIHFRSRKEWVSLLESIGFSVQVDEHVKTWYGFYVPHSLFVAEKRTRH